MMFAATRLTIRTVAVRSLASRPMTARLLSSSSSSGETNHDDPMTIKFSPPETLSTEMASGIAETTMFYIKYGLSNQRLRGLAADKDMPIVDKWQKMMEIFLSTQVHVVAGMGYAGSAEGLTRYAHDLATCLQHANPTSQDQLRDVRRDTWRELVASCFALDVEEIPTLSIVDARNLMHKVSSRMIEPEMLLEIQQRASKIEDPDTEVEIAKKHSILQEVIVTKVYLGGSPSLVEEAGFGSGPEAYAKLQCAMSDHEGDPLIGQYASAAMMKIWEAAGLDMSSMHGLGAG